ncbi:hypothetical protein DF137_36930, partial [Burkholderia stagnalis]
MPKAAKNSTLATVRIRVLPRFCWRHYGDHPRRHYADPRQGETVVPASELAAAIKEIKELQRLLG